MACMAVSTGQQMEGSQLILGSIRSFPFVVKCVSLGAGSG